MLQREKNMKRLPKLLLAATLVLMLSACNTKTNNEETNNTAVSAPVTETTEESSANSGSANHTNDNSGTESNTTTDTNTTTIALKALTITINKTTLNKDENTTLKVEATYADGSTKELNSNVTWVVTPSHAVQVNNNTLTAKKDGNVTVQATVGGVNSNTLNLNIYWEVDGHRLPPEPDPAVNNATLLGVDVNDNGVRDDVERWIYDRYKDEHPIMIPLKMQVARAYQKIIVDPSKAKETTKIMETAEYCEWAFTSLSANYFGRKPLVLIEPEDAIKEDKEMKYVQYNTTQRARAYGNYNQKLSGGVYELEYPNEKWIENCDFNTTKYIEMSEKL